MRKELLILSVFIVLLFYGCKLRKQVIELPRITKTKVTEIKFDSIRIVDTIFVPFFYDIKTKETYNIKKQKEIPVRRESHQEHKFVTVVRDSFILDTIFVPKPVPYPVTKEFTWVQQTKIKTASLVLIILAGFLLIKYRKKILGLILKLL